MALTKDDVEFGGDPGAVRADLAAPSAPSEPSEPAGTLR